MPPGASVLVVDDDADVREMLRMVLEGGGYQVATAKDGADALDHLNGGDLVGLILLDLMMPVLDGEQFLRAHRSSVRSDIPVVIVSGHGDARDIARTLGANGYLRKPVELDELLLTVGRFMANGVEPKAR
jgi:CheY-like chemotaxis protein